MTETILIVTPEENGSQSSRMTVNDVTVIASTAGEDGKDIRGYGADYVLAHSSTDQEIVEDVIMPMVLTSGGELVFYG